MGKPEPSRQGDDKITGTLFRAYLTGLEALGWRAAVRAQVGAGVQRLMDAPPLHTVWLDGNELTEILSAVAQLEGMEGVRQLGYEATRLSTGKFLMPLIQSTLAMYGHGPASLLGHLDTICRPFFRGLSFTYTPEGPSSGSLVLRSTYRMTAPAFAAWEGSLRLLFDECRVKGTLSPSVIAADGRAGTMKVRW